jgi:hypothetical protein
MYDKQSAVTCGDVVRSTFADTRIGGTFYILNPSAQRAALGPAARGRTMKEKSATPVVGGCGSEA